MINELFELTSTIADSGPLVLVLLFVLSALTIGIPL